MALAPLPRRTRSDQHGFTLIELMVVVLIIAVLLAIAIPMFTAAQNRANDRAAQSNVRNAHVVELIIYADRQRFTDDVAELSIQDPTIAYTQILGNMTANGRVVYVEMQPDTFAPLDTVLVGGRSQSGRCFWIRSTGGINQLRFADNDCSGVPPVATFRRAW